MRRSLLLLSHTTIRAHHQDDDDFARQVQRFPELPGLMPDNTQKPPQLTSVAMFALQSSIRHTNPTMSDPLPTWKSRDVMNPPN